MSFLTRLAILFYVGVISVVCGVAILFVTRVVLLQDIFDLMGRAYDEDRLRLIVGLVSGGIIFFSFLFARLIFGHHAQERTIAFDNPSGRVSVSLNALEDLVRRIILRVPEIKEVRSGILATKKGLEVQSRIILRTEVNIPELTNHLQEMIKSKIQDTIGIEEKVIVKIHVVKMVTDETKVKRQKDEPEERPTPTIPFQGYRP